MKKIALVTGVFALLGGIVIPTMVNAEVEDNATVVTVEPVTLEAEVNNTLEVNKEQFTDTSVIKVEKVDISDVKPAVRVTSNDTETTESVVDVEEVKIPKPQPKVEQYTNGSDSYNYNSGGHLTRSGGVYYYGDHKETWYSTNEPGQTVTAKDIPGKHAGSDGVIRDADGYICVATNQDFHKFGEVIETSLGLAKVYDCGCRYGTVDIYTTW